MGHPHLLSRVYKHTQGKSVYIRWHVTSTRFTSWGKYQERLSKMLVACPQGNRFSFFRRLREQAYRKCAMRVFSHCKAHPGRVWGHALSDASIRRKRHENVMSIVMSNSLKR